MNPIVVHVVRPYANEQDYLAAEAWSIDARSMLLIDVEALPPDTAVLFDITLAGGQKPIRAEARVVGVVAAQGERPGGLRVRYKRFGAATKAFIERAVKAKSASGEAERPSSPDAASSPEAELPSAPSASGAAEAERSSLPEVRVSMTDLEAVRLPEPPPERSGLRQRVPGPIAAPANRDELLARLRSRRQAS